MKERTLEKVRNLPYKIRIRWAMAKVHRQIHAIIKTSKDADLACSALISALLRQRINGARLEGHDEGVDLVVFIARLKLTMPFIFSAEGPVAAREASNPEAQQINEQRRRDYSNYKVEVDSLVEKVNSDPVVRSAVATYYLIKQFSYSLSASTEVASYYGGIATEWDPNCRPYALSDISTVRKRIRKELKQVRDSIADRNAIKISVSLQQATTVLALLSALFLASGYVYDLFYLGAFGIDVANYFEIGDYVSSSIEVIRKSVFGGALAVVVTFLSFHDSSRSPAAVADANYRHFNWLRFFILGSSIFLGGLSWWREQYTILWLQLPLMAVIISVWLAPRVAVRLFQSPMYAVFAVQFFIIYSAYLTSTLLIKIDSVKKLDGTSPKTEFYVFDEKIPVIDHDLVLLASNSRFLFFRSVGTGEILIVPQAMLRFARSGARVGTD